MYQPNQPTPVPLNPVENIDIKFENFQNQQLMHIKWSGPSLMPQIGCSAWNHWTYGLNINNQITSTNLNQTHFEQNVDFDTIYDIQIHAQSPGKKYSTAHFFQNWKLLKPCSKDLNFPSLCETWIYFFYKSGEDALRLKKDFGL